MQGAHDVLVFAYRVAVGAVAQAAAESSFRPTLYRRAGIRARSVGRRSPAPADAATAVASSLPISRPVASTSRSRAGVAGMLRASQRAERAVGVRRVAAGAGGRRDRPFVARATARLRRRAGGSPGRRRACVADGCARRWGAVPAARPARRWRRRRRAAPGARTAVDASAGRARRRPRWAWGGQHQPVFTPRCEKPSVHGRLPTLFGRGRGAMTLPKTRTGL